MKPAVTFAALQRAAKKYEREIVSASKLRREMGRFYRPPGELHVAAHEAARLLVALVKQGEPCLMWMMDGTPARNAIDLGTHAKPTRTPKQRRSRKP